MNEEVKEKKKIKKPRSKKNYINNREMFECICKWQDDLVDDPSIPMPEYLGECFIKIADNLLHKTPYNTLADDMKGMALLNCCLYAKNGFDRSKGENPFAYFTSYVNNAFAAVYNNEKKLIDAKFNMLKELCDGEEYDYRDRNEEIDY
jgi:hypothetical protein